MSTWSRKHLLLGAAVVAVAVAVAVVWLLARGLSLPVGSRDASSRAASEPPAGRPVAPSQAAAVGGRTAVISSRDAVSGEGAGEDLASGAEAGFGFCPGDAPSKPLRRASLQAVVALRLTELQDRYNYLMQAAQPPPDKAWRAALGRVLAGGAAAPSDADVTALAQATVRRDHGFDYLASALLWVGEMARRKGDLETAALFAERAASADPTDAAPWVLLAIVRASAPRVDERGLALRQAYRLAPDEPAVALAWGRWAAHTPELDAAVGAFDRYLTATPNDVASQQRRARLAIQRDVQRGFHQASRAGITLLSPPVVASALADAVLGEIETAVADASQLLAVARPDPLTAVIYEDRADMLAITCVQSWAGALFDGTLRLALDELQAPARRRQIVRHEILHAVLVPRVGATPAWFNEGLAQYFAGEGEGGAAQRTFALMLANRTYVPFASLDATFQVFSSAPDVGIAYHQSLAMVMLLVDRYGEGVIRECVELLRRQRPAPDGRGLLQALADARRPGSAGAGALTGEDLLAFLQRRRPAAAR